MSDETGQNAESEAPPQVAVVIDITGGTLSPGERAIHAKYQSDDPDADYYDPCPTCETCGPKHCGAHGHLLILGDPS